VRGRFGQLRRHSGSAIARRVFKVIYDAGARGAYRIDGDELFLTHEFLSIMLSVHRASITETLRMRADDDLIAIKRGAIAIVDLARLRKRRTALTSGSSPTRAGSLFYEGSCAIMSLHHDLPKKSFSCAGTE
jgi:Crp-like helix-turn-helix domain